MIRPAALLAAVPFVALLLTFHARDSQARSRNPLGDSLRVLAHASVPQVSVGALAVSLDRGDTLLAYNEDHRLVPGSNTKLFTTGAFLKRHGPDTRWATLLLARGEASVKDGGARVRFKGDLVLRGSGIPDVTALRSVGSKGLPDSLAALLRAGGLERFEGTLWIDGSIFARDPYPEGWAHEDLVYSYSAPVNGVLANGNAVALVATGGRDGVVVSLEPPDSPLEVRGRPTLGAPGSSARLTVTRELGSRVLEVSGTVPPGGVARQQVAVTDPDSTAGLLLLAAMKRAGIETKAVVRVMPARPEDAPKQRKDLERFQSIPWDGAAATEPWSAVRKDRAIVALTLLSPTSREIAGIVNTFSLNPEAEALLRMLDPAPRGKGTVGGIAELTRIGSAEGIPPSDILLSDGSGLSRMNVVTPRALVGWIAALDRDSTVGPSFRDGLSAPGGRGTRANRFAGLPPAVTVRGKTGTLRNVTSLSCYLTAESGERIAFAMMSNGTYASVAPARVVEDAMVRLLARYRRDATRPERPMGIPR